MVEDEELSLKFLKILPIQTLSFFFTTLELEPPPGTHNSLSLVLSYPDYKLVKRSLSHILLASHHDPKPHLFQCSELNLNIICQLPASLICQLPTYFILPLNQLFLKPSKLHCFICQLPTSLYCPSINHS